MKPVDRNICLIILSHIFNAVLNNDGGKLDDRLYPLSHGRISHLKIGHIVPINLALTTH